MIDEKLLDLIRCPNTGETLAVAGAETVAELNKKIDQGELRDASDQLVQGHLDQGLQNESGDRLYPVRGGIPTLVSDAAILLEQQE